MEKDNFAIEGMVCASCAQTVEKAVAQLPDVSDVAVNLATESMQVEHGSQVSVQKDHAGSQKCGLCSDFIQHS